MGAIIINCIVLLLVILVNIIVIRYIVKRSYYLSKNEASILSVALSKQKGLIDEVKYQTIRKKLNSKA